MEARKAKSCDTKAVFGTKEWAKFNINIMKGCLHDCKYCYAKSMALRYGTTNIESWKDETPNSRKIPKRYQKKDGTTMFPTTHDITPDNLDYCISFLSSYLLPGNEVLIVSKPHLECIKSICDSFPQYRDNILFRFTIGSTNSSILKFWEPGAPDFEERLSALVYAYEAGFKTSVSVEPMLDDKVDELIDHVLPYVNDAIWIGKPNDINGHGDPETLQRSRSLIASQPDDYIWNLYNRYHNNPQIKWKESIKKIIGLEIPTESGLDI